MWKPNNPHKKQNPSQIASTDDSWLKYYYHIRIEDIERSVIRGIALLEMDKACQIPAPQTTRPPSFINQV
jgi:hypothetical protein